MDVITTHLNADFDALASMLAARKLYPGARLVFPGSQEKNLRDFLKATPLQLEFTRVKNLPFDQVSRLIVVDTKLSSRLGDLAPLADRPDIELHLYDHHPHNPRDLKGAVEVLEEVGSCATIFTEIFLEKGIPLSPTEATVLALGIYEDTGFLAFSSVTPRDLRAAAALLEKGADLNIVADFLSREMTPEQVKLLERLISAAERYLINGVEVVVTIAKSDRYIGDLAVLIHKLKDMENLNVVIALIQMEQRIYLIARSRLEAVDAGELCHRFGGGGHPTAASATIRKRSLGEAKRRVLNVLKEIIPPLATARDIMFFPVKSVPAGTSISEARKICINHGINYLPILRDESFLGLITLDTIEKTIFHGLGESPVEEFMEVSLPTARPDTPFQEIEALVVRQRFHFIPIVENGNLVGAISMREFLRILHEDMVKKPAFREESAPSRSPTTTNLRSHLYDRLPSSLVELLREIGEDAVKAHTQAFLVGGMVRDLLLGLPTIDLDIVIEGDAVSFSRNLAQKLVARVASHPKFGTTVMTLPSGLKIDFATARTEYYAHPAALPTIETSSVRQDLYRRDFTINALAIDLTPPRFGTLLDFFGGWADLHHKVIRILHPLSFVEDPTRIYRAIRLEQRLGFTIEEKTEQLIQVAVQKRLFHRLAGKRIFDELVLILKEIRPIPVLKRLHSLNVLGLLHPSLRRQQALPASLKIIPSLLAKFREKHPDEEIQDWLIYFWSLSERLTLRELETLLTTLEVSPSTSNRILHGRRLMGTLEDPLNKKTLKSPWEIYQLFQKIPIEELITTMAGLSRSSLQKPIWSYLDHLRSLAPAIGGKDLKNLGIPPGPLYSRILSKVKEAILEGRVSGKEEEMELVKNLVEAEKNQEQKNNPGTSARGLSPRRPAS